MRYCSIAESLATTGHVGNKALHTCTYVAITVTAVLLSNILERKRRKLQYDETAEGMHTYFLGGGLSGRGTPPLHAAPDS